jgi:hypothetical protein
MLGPPTSLGRVERAVRVNLALEPREESRTGCSGRLTCFTLGVQGVGGEPGAQAPLSEA